VAQPSAITSAETKAATVQKGLLAIIVRNSFVFEGARVTAKKNQNYYCRPAGHRASKLMLIVSERFEFFNVD
jgi:hypothetical protein